MKTPYTRLLEWTRDNCLPLDRSFDALEAPLRALIGNARLVSIGEGLHGAREPIEFRNALFAWLVERMGFCAVALESGLSAGLTIDAFVQGGTGELEDVVASGITSGLHRYPQQAGLVHWMRAFNAERPSGGKPLSFYGIDTSPLSGSPAAAIEMALAILRRVDAKGAAELHQRLEPLRPCLHVDRTSPEPRGYTTLDEAQRDAVTAVVEGLANRIEPYAEDAARAVRQAESYLRQFERGWCAAKGPSGAWPSIAISDRQKAENVEHLLRQRLAASGRMLLFSHLGHASTLPVSIALGAETVALPEMMGSHLKRLCAEGELLTIGHLIGDNQCQPEVGVAPADSLEGRLATLGHDALLLDLRRAPPEVLEELHAAPHRLHGQLPVHQLSPGLGIDVIYFTRQATPAR
jgi:erythromycin esterase